MIVRMLLLTNEVKMSAILVDEGRQARRLTTACERGCARTLPLPLANPNVYAPRQRDFFEDVSTCVFVMFVPITRRVESPAAASVRDRLQVAPNTAVTLNVSPPSLNPPVLAADTSYVAKACKPDLVL